MTNTKLLKATLAFVAATTLSLSACSNKEEPKDFAPIDNESSAPAKPASEPGDVTTPEAKAELQEACDQISDDEAAVILGVDTKATAWSLEKSTGEAMDYDMETGEYESNGKPQCVWVVTAENDGEARTLSITLRGPSDGSGMNDGGVQFPNGDTGTYGSDDDATLYVSPEGSAYEYTFAADFTVYNELGEPTSNDYLLLDSLRDATAQAAYEVVMN